MKKVKKGNLIAYMKNEAIAFVIAVTKDANDKYDNDQFTGIVIHSKFDENMSSYEIGYECSGWSLRDEGFKKLKKADLNFIFA